MHFMNRRFDVDGRKGEFGVDLFGDTHLGSKSVDESLLKKHIKETKDNGNYWVHLGDAVDGIVPNDKRYNAENLSDWAWDALREKRIIQAEWQKFKELFEPIADKCLFVLEGDGKHNRKDDIADCMSDTIASMGIVDENKKPLIYQSVYLTASVYRSTTASERIPLVFHHGYTAGRKHGGKINNMVDTLAYFPEALGFFCAHGHTKTVTPPIACIVERENHCHSLYRRAAMTGSYLKTYAEDTTGYAVVKLLNPVALGRITVVLSPFNCDDQKRLQIINY